MFPEIGNVTSWVLIRNQKHRRTRVGGLCVVTIYRHLLHIAPSWMVSHFEVGDHRRRPIVGLPYWVGKVVGAAVVDIDIRVVVCSEKIRFLMFCHHSLRSRKSHFWVLNERCLSSVDWLLSLGIVVKVERETKMVMESFEQDTPLLDTFA